MHPNDSAPPSSLLCHSGGAAGDKRSAQSDGGGFAFGGGGGGPKIVDGEDLDADVADEVAFDASEEDWEVVKEDETEQVASDEMIARAAQLIGSALFRAI